MILFLQNNYTVDKHITDSNEYKQEQGKPLWAGYEQLSYQQFNRNIMIHVT